MFNEYLRLGEILVRKGLLNEERLAQALASQKSSGSRLGEILSAMGWLNEEDLARALAEQFNFDYIDLETIEPDHQALKLVSGRWALSKLILPICFLDGQLEVAVSDPIDVDSTDELRSKTRAPIITVVACPSKLRSAIIRAYTIEVEECSSKKLSRRRVKLDHKADRSAIIGAVDRLNSRAA